MPRPSDDAAYLAKLDVALTRIADFGANVVVVALGLDAFVGDPFKGLAVTTEGFGRISSAIAGLGLPCLIVQEGGYICDQLGDNLTSALGGFAAVG